MAENKNESPKSIAWDAPEFVHYPKNIWWYVFLIVVGLGFVIFFSFQKDFLTAGLFFLLLVIIIYYGKATPRLLHIEITTHGIKINDNRLSYQQIKSFWLVYDPPTVKTLNFETTANFNRFLTLQLGEQNPLPVRELLLEYLAEDLDRGEQTVDKISRNLKF